MKKRWKRDVLSGKSKKITVFVYGTLTSVNGNYMREMDAEGPYPGVLHGYYLYQVTPFYPGVVPGEGGRVWGELYYVNPEVLKKLDDYEDVPHLYLRKEVEVELLDGRKIRAWCYIWNGPPQGRRIPWEEMPWRSPTLGGEKRG